MEDLDVPRHSPRERQILGRSVVGKPLEATAVQGGQCTGYLTIIVDTGGGRERLLKGAVVPLMKHMGAEPW